MWGFLEEKVFSGKSKIDVLKAANVQEVAGIPAVHPFERLPVAKASRCPWGASYPMASKNDQKLPDAGKINQLWFMSMPFYCEQILVSFVAALL